MRTDFLSQRPLTIDVNPVRIERSPRVPATDSLTVSAVRPVMRDLPQSQPDPNLPKQGQRAQSGYQQIEAISDHAPKIQGFDAWV